MAKNIFKFRAWQVKDNDEDVTPRMLDNEEIFNYVDPLYVIENDEIIIMQFIGRLDTTGKEIYEDDILRGKSGEICLARFHAGWNAFYCSMLMGRDEYNDLVRMTGSKYFYTTDEYEIIGNIHENPEILEEILSKKLDRKKRK